MGLPGQMPYLIVMTSQRKSSEATHKFLFRYKVYMFTKLCFSSFNSIQNLYIVMTSQRKSREATHKFLFRYKVYLFTKLCFSSFNSIQNLYLDTRG